MPKYLTHAYKNNMYTDIMTIHSYITYKYYKIKVCQTMLTVICFNSCTLRN